MSGGQINGPAVELDLRGSVCPGPIGGTLAALKKLPPKSRSMVITGYLSARQAIPCLLERGDVPDRVHERGRPYER